VIAFDFNDEITFAACFIYQYAVGDGTSGKALRKSFGTGFISVIVRRSSTARIREIHNLPLSLMTLVKGFYQNSFSTFKETRVLVSQSQRLQCPIIDVLYQKGKDTDVGLPRWLSSYIETPFSIGAGHEARQKLSDYKGWNMAL